MISRFCSVVLLVLLMLFPTLIFSQQISLAGQWHFKMDPFDSGIANKWFNTSLHETVVLPGSMAENKKGDDITLKTKWTGSIYDSSFFFNPRLKKYREPGNLKIPFWLTPAKHYVGAAWYQKEIIVPADWKNKRITVRFERAHFQTKLWIDDKEVGMQNSLVVAHEYDVTSFITPGKHRISVRIDNRLKDINVGPDSHSVTDHTSGNWNGLIGRLTLTASARVWMEDVQVYPDIHSKIALVTCSIKSLDTLPTKGKIILSAHLINVRQQQLVKAITANYTLNKGTGLVRISMPIGDGMQLWNEFNPALYLLNANLVSSNGDKDYKELQFGMREIKVVGNQILLNDQPISLRGTVNNSEFPLTGYPSMDVAAWEKIFKVSKAHGLNHFRFHSFCPPEAAFIAADRQGFYLQPEGPSWPNHGTSLGDGRPIDDFLWNETVRMAKAYGNYASFCMLSAGNEPAGKNQAKWLTNFILKWRAQDKRRIYTGASVAMSWPLVPENDYMIKSGSRGLSWSKGPESLSDYRSSIDKFTMPYITHEMGQWCVFPDFTEIPKFTGVYKARNYEMFQEDLGDRGMKDLANQFMLSSGKLQLLCYKNEIEKSLRTPGLGGFQLLGLQDFPGQGTALVGTMNVFWEDKPYNSAKIFSRFCNSTVPLTRMPKFVYQNTESLKAAVEIYHYGKAPLVDAIVHWQLKNSKGTILFKGDFKKQTIPIGNCISVGNIELPLNTITIASQLNLEIAIANTTYANDWNVWVYPTALAIPVNAQIYDCRSLNDTAIRILQAGGKVFLNAAGKITKGKEISQSFTPVFWNTSWFKMRPPHTLGFICDPAHPAFANFPTDNHSDLQWFELVNGAQVMHLEDFPPAFRPLVQPIDTWFINRRLALVMEVKVGKGKLIITSADVSADASSRPVAKQLFVSLHQYMASANFDPKWSIELQTIKDLMEKPSREIFDPFTRDAPDELKKPLTINQNK